MSKNNIVKKAALDAKILWHSLFRGMSAADDVLTNSGKSGDGSVTAEQKLEQNSVYASLVKGEITQEVKDLRYETYQVARKASEYQVIGGGTAVKKNTMLKNIDAKVENEDELKVVLVQANHLIPPSVYDAVEEALNKSSELPPEHRLKINRKYYSRFKIEDYATQLVVKESGDGNYILDFYCASAKIAIELDGSQHYEEEGHAKDAERDTYLNERGITILRYSNRDVNQQFRVVCEDIENHLIRQPFGLPSNMPPACCSPQGGALRGSPVDSPDGKAS